jgi:7,8-dihydropterin-6-yl-methyl-4-(beta-D-ribofuranosyl)aminobenzene 5'-phosphate synthase
MPYEVRNAIHAEANRCRWVHGPTEISTSIWVSGPVPRKAGVESAGAELFRDSGGRVPDSVEDDQALWISTDKGLFVIVGCCHAGVINTLEFIKAASGEERVIALVGGFHLNRADDTRIDATLKYLRSLA